MVLHHAQVLMLRRIHPLDGDRQLFQIAVDHGPEGLVVSRVMLQQIKPFFDRLTHRDLLSLWRADRTPRRGPQVCRFGRLWITSAP
jgi:hypothetical protein